ncbi:transcriptional regulator [Streptomyces sp. NWU339]|uniref:LysR family transcriptional regulator n=1 Tax=Streptomyces sp. NWU339 TaxID=2185284 RepID=UPI000D68434D|nr:LysR family transcriptional regulator [Streptomyces sp. NWU339]PWI09979.1 transcriptional regulator [Streptomyces sp. NWU339]
MIDIYETEFRKADLNLLVVFSALMRERSVTRAAAALHLSQSATSAALGRLRGLFDDELFTRTGGGVEPTPRAVALARRIEPALGLIHGVVTDRDRFDPRTARRVFTLGMSDDLEAALMPRLLAATAGLRDVRLAVRQANRNTVTGMIDRGEIDLGVSAAPAHGADHRSHGLFDSGYTCLFDHRLLPLGTPITLDDYLTHPHLLISYDGRRGIVDDILEARGLERRVIASTTHFAGAALHLPALPALVTLPTHAATVYAEALGLTTSPPPLPMPTYTVSSIWHGTLTDDPAHLWLRRLVEDAARGNRQS